MEKKSFVLFHIMSFVILLSGCSTNDVKTSNVSIIYGACALLSLILLVIYCYIIHQKEIWFLLLFGAIFVANIGYLSLSVAKNLEEALLANRIVYLGTVFLPMSVLMIILKITKIHFKNWLPALLTVIVSIVFLIAASPGYSDIYYKEVSFEIVNGVPTMHKVYGIFHNLYFVYILVFFAVMVTLVCYAIVKKKTTSASHAVVLSVAVGINIAVWILERSIYIEFELLSVTYLFTGLFLLALQIMVLENERLRALASTTASTMHTKNFDKNLQVPSEHSLETESSIENNTEQIEIFLKGVNTLTPTEHTIYNFYVDGKTTSEILTALNIKENTLKFHNKNIYGKLGVSSRKQLLEIYKKLK